MSEHTNNAVFLQRVLDANPSMIFVLDEAGAVVVANKAAMEFVGKNPAATLENRTGNILDCVNSFTHPDGCGSSDACDACEIRLAILSALAGKKSCRLRSKMTVRRKKKAVDCHFLITVSPFEYGKRSWIYMVLTDVSDVSELKEIVPICARCKKIKKDDKYWHAVEDFISSHIDLTFTHGYCPNCTQELLEELDAESAPNE